MPEPAVLYSRTGSIGTLLLNRPDQRNSMTPELLDEFSSVLDEVVADKQARAVIITGKGNCFSAGADLNSSMQRSDDRVLPHQASFGMYEPFLKVLKVQAPVIAAMNGHAVGGGFGLCLLADMRIANRSAKYGANFARLGIHSGMAISFLLPRLVGVARASELLFTGALVDGQEAERIGLVNHAVGPDDVVPQATILAERIASAAPLAFRR
ncbi:MAG: enoyl-CoA hydratase/isomerase family protein [Polyangiales bacterium]